MFKPIIKISLPPFLQHMLWLVTAVVLVFTLASAIHLKREGLVRHTQVNFTNKIPLEHMLTTDDIYGILRDHYDSDLVGIPTRHVQTDVIEDLVEANDYVKSSKVYIDKLDRLAIEIVEREPLVRLHDGDISGYIDLEGKLLAWSENYTPRVPVLVGNYEGLDKEKQMSLVDLFKTFRADEFMSVYIDQVFIEEDGELTLIPSLGSHRIFFGNTDGVHEKIEKLKAYYKQKVDDYGWKRCKSLDLRYKDQIICEKSRT